jgi:hypothetical protein
VGLGPTDCGHRLGNFHNYYTFNPAPERLRFMPASVVRRIQQQFQNADPALVCDLGCNEGDITFQMSQLLSVEGGGAFAAPELGSAGSAEGAAETAGAGAGAAEAVGADEHPSPKRARIQPSDTSDKLASPSSASAPVIRTVPVHFLGVDVDPELIERGNARVTAESAKAKESASEFDVAEGRIGFRTSDLMDPSDTGLESYLAERQRPRFSLVMCLR